MFQNLIGKVLLLSLMILFAACTASFSRQAEGSSMKEREDVVAEKECSHQIAAGPPQAGERRERFILTIKVEDSQDSSEIPNAEVFVSLKSGKPQCRKTGPRGLAKIKLLPGETGITVIATGYKTYIEKKDVKKSEEITIKLVKQD